MHTSPWPASWPRIFATFPHRGAACAHRYLLQRVLIATPRGAAGQVLEPGDEPVYLGPHARGTSRPGLLRQRARTLGFVGTVAGWPERLLWHRQALRAIAACCARVRAHYLALAGAKTTANVARPHSLLRARGEGVLRAAHGRDAGCSARCQPACLRAAPAHAWLATPCFRAPPFVPGRGVAYYHRGGARVRRLWTGWSSRKSCTSRRVC